MNLKRFAIGLVLGCLLSNGGCSPDESTFTPEPVNTAPEIISPTAVDATGGIYFSYRAVVSDPDGPDDSLWFEWYPSWLTADADSLFGTPPDGATDTGFAVIADDGISADTAHIQITVIPCMIVYGDSRTNHAIHGLIVDSMMTFQPAVVFHTGDLVDNGLDTAQWTIFNTITAAMRSQAEFFPALGNHENQSQLYFDNFDLPNNEQWYSVDRYGIHFIILNSCTATSDTSEQYRWLEADLASVPDTIDFIVPIFHHPPYSTGMHTEDEKGLRETWVPLFEQGGVDIVFNGHDHDYERSLCGGIYYIVAGGGGAPLRDQAREHPCSQLFLSSYHFCKLSVVGDRLIVKVYDLTMNVIDEFALRRDAGPAALQ